MPEFVTTPNNKRYKVYVTWVDHGSYSRDDRVSPALSNLSLEGGRNIHVTGFRLDGAGDPFKYNVLVPQELQGSFKVPQIGDTIFVEEDYRITGASPVYIYSTYNDVPLTDQTSSPIPAWGSIAGDHGHLRSHRDHNAQFLPTAKSSFTKRYIKSVTGYRFRKYYGHVYNTQTRFLDRGKFAVRGDAVFDVEKGSPNMSNVEINTESGVDIVSRDDNSLSVDKNDYPNPLNAPAKREEDKNYKYVSVVPRILDKQINSDLYAGPGNEQNSKKNEKYINTLKNKNYLAYQPIVDRNYFDYLDSLSEDEEGNKSEPLERELPAAEEYQVALRGNNKLLIQDQYGDGEQLLITLKNQYDAGFTVVHNVENSQVRVRDHLGQGVLLEGNPKSPRVVSWTTERQFIDMGSVREFDPETGEATSYGEYLYLRNGAVYGQSETSFGRFPDAEIPRDGDASNEISQQELMMVSSRSEADLTTMLEDISSRMSTGINDLVSGNLGNGLYFRNNVDPNATNQHFSIFSDFSTQPVLTAKMYQEHTEPLNSKLIKTDFTQTVDDTQSKYNYLNYYKDPSVESTVTSTNVSNASTAREDISTVWKGPTGTSIYSRSNFGDSSKSNSQETNTFVGKSEYTKTRQAKISGTVEETTNSLNLLNLNSVETFHDTTPNTRVTQKVAALKVNQYEMTPSEVITTQYVADVPYTEVKQDAASINLNRKIAGLTVNIGDDGIGAGNINIGNSTNNDTITIRGNDVDIFGSTVDITEV